MKTRIVIKAPTGASFEYVEYDSKTKRGAVYVQQHETALKRHSAPPHMTYTKADEYIRKTYRWAFETGGQ